MCKKKVNFSTSIPNFEMDFDFMIDLMMGKESLNHILFRIQKSFAYFQNIGQFFSFFKLRQRMGSHFKKKISPKILSVNIRTYRLKKKAPRHGSQGYYVGILSYFFAYNSSKN